MTTLDQALLRWSAVCREWQETSTGNQPRLGAFLAGWYMRETAGDVMVSDLDFPDSYHAGWNEADTTIKIAERERG